MPLICRPTHTVFLFLSLSVLISLWRTRSPSFYLFFPPSLFSWYFLIKIKFQDISGLKTLFFLMFIKVYIYLKTHPLTRSRKDPPSHKCHKHPVFEGVRCQVKKSRKVTQTPCTTRYDFVTTLQKQIACGAGLRRLCEASALKWLFKPVHNHFLKNLFWTCL